MKKEYIGIVMSGLIVLSGTVKSDEILPQEPLKSAEIVVGSKLEVVEQTVANAPIKAPILVPFNLDLYKLYCHTRQSQYWSSIYGIMTTTPVNIISIMSQFMIFKTYPQILIPADFSSWALGWKIGRVIGAGVQVGSLLIAAYYAFNNLVNIGPQATQYFEWEDREELNILEQQALWHKEIFEHFGKPTITGSVPLTGKYLIKGYKKYGAGQVIFDPFDPVQVKILLDSYGSITEDLRCSTIEIIAE